ncbi:MAG: HAD-IA family hydrolase [Actinobacteria bacterium]|nr:HAD-IA family hydrolase [Actinomycetota bacterium]
MSAARPGKPRPFRLRAVLFDFDGTLTHPGALDFAAIKREVGCPPDQFVLEWILSLEDGRRRAAATLALERFEIAAAQASAPNEGAEDLVPWLREQGLRIGVLTRNGRSAVDRALQRFTALSPADFDVIVTRDDAHLAPKPAPDGVLHAAATMGVEPHETLVVGDYLLDAQAGRAAGAVTAHLVNRGVRDHGEPADSRTEDCDFVVGRLAELRDVVRLGLPLPQGKLPNDLLAGFLAGAAGDDPALLVPPGVGEDAAAIDLGGSDVLVAHGDPITLGGDDLGESAVLVNVNDLAAAGADPRWLIATVLLPPASTPSQALAVLDGLAAAAARSGVTLAGGHTEVTDVVTRPVVSLTALGTVDRAGLKDKRSARRGDRVLLTKQLAMEGAALLAEELEERLRALGMGADELAACRALQERVSILPEARVAREFAGVRAMHDVTEGGLATALRELSAATGRGLTVHRDLVPISPETARVCRLLDADPLGLIASGSLLVCCDPAQAPSLLAALDEAGIPATDIGELTEEDAGVTALERGEPAPWPAFDTDEAARLLSGRGRPRGGRKPDGEDGPAD